MKVSWGEAINRTGQEGAVVSVTLHTHKHNTIEYKYTIQGSGACLSVFVSLPIRFSVFSQFKRRKSRFLGRERNG